MDDMDAIYDMETSDPDDAVTLALLCWHPKVSLRAVTVTPGTRAQIGVVRRILEMSGVKVPVGSYKPTHPKNCVSEWHNKVLGETQPSEPDGFGYSIIRDALSDYPELTMITGAPLCNPRAFIESLKGTCFFYPIKRWVANGGFAGDNVVAAEDRLAKFAGKVTCPTFNFNGDRPGAKEMLSCPLVKRRVLVSKNVCHGVAYSEEIHARLSANPFPRPGWMTMRKLLEHCTYGKLMHDPLAAAVAIDESICRFREVEIFTEKGEWGSKPAEHTNTFISVGVDKDAFWRTLMGLPVK